MKYQADLPLFLSVLCREIMEQLVERAGKAEAEIEKLYAEFERLQKLQPEEGETPEELVRFVIIYLFILQLWSIYIVKANGRF